MAIVRKTNDYMDATNFGLIFKGLVRPMLEYAAPVWSLRTINYVVIIKKLHIKLAGKELMRFSHLTTEQQGSGTFYLIKQINRKYNKF